MSATDDIPRVWVGCLGCYNAGNLAGGWFDASDAPTDVTAWNASDADKGWTWASHMIEHHEELWVFDHENFHGLLSGECSPMEAQRLAQLLDESGNPEAFGAYADNVGREYATIEGFEESFCGEYEREEDYAREMAEEMGAFDPSNYVDSYNESRTDISDRWPFTCIDWDHAWRELRIGGDNWSAPAPNYNVFIFRSI